MAFASKGPFGDCSSMWQDFFTGSRGKFRYTVMQNNRAISALLSAIASLIFVRTAFIFLDSERIRALGHTEKNDSSSVKKNVQPVRVTLSAATSDQEDAIEPPSCFQYNSEEWLKGPRFGNIREGITEEMTRRMLVDLDHQLMTSNAPRLFGQSMCMSDSRFVNRTDEANVDDPEAVRIWAVRLSYLVFHYHQNRLAQREAIARSSCTASDLEKYDIGPFDFECDRNAKYAIFDLSGIGIGANMRGGVAIALMMGAFSCRIVLFINKAPAEPSVFQVVWPLASCERVDHQCFFFPMSPCVLTIDDLNNAWIMDRPESRNFLKKDGLLPEEHKDDKVIRVVSFHQPSSETSLPVLEKLSRMAHEIVDKLPEWDPQIAIMRKAADSIAVLDPDREEYQYAASTHKVLHAAEIYAMRPNPVSYAKLSDILEEVVPKDLGVETAIGLPIRASDKCKGESECLSFDEHMQVVDDLWQAKKRPSDAYPTIVFTTESKSILADQLAFANSTERQNQFQNQFHFVTNTKDVTPDTGRLEGADHLGGEDEVMLSAMSSLMFQLKPRYSVGNCCSNFHNLLADYLYSGCGSASSHTFMCLQDNPNPLLRVCCAWDKNCPKEKQAALKALAQNNTGIKAS